MFYQMTRIQKHVHITKFCLCFLLVSTHKMYLYNKMPLAGQCKVKVMRWSMLNVILKSLAQCEQKMKSVHYTGQNVQARSKFVNRKRNSPEKCATGHLICNGKKT